MPQPIEYVGGPYDGARSDGPIEPFILAPVAGSYGPSSRRIVGVDDVERVVRAWTPTGDGLRNAPTCVEACGRGCPAYGTTT